MTGDQLSLHRCAAGTCKPSRSASPITRALFTEISRRGITYAELGRRIGYCESHFSKFKHGKADMKLWMVEAIAQVLNMTLELKEK